MSVPVPVTFHQESLLHHDVLPRLIDSVLCPEGPEMHFIRTWKERSATWIWGDGRFWVDMGDLSEST